MPGIFGYFGKSNDELISLNQMEKKLMHETWYASFAETKCGINAGAISLAPFFSRKNNFAEDDNYLLIIEGNVATYQSYSISQGGNFANILLSEYKKNGEDLTNKLDGSFNILIFEKDSQELKIINDRFGFSYLYYYEDEEMLLFSPEYKTFLDYRFFEKKLNYKAISLFLSSNVVLGNETYFDKVKLLPPASILTFNGEKVSIRKYWSPEFHALNNKNTNYFLDQAIGLYKKSVDKKLPEKCSGRIILPLSGGLDSRLIFGLMRDKHSVLDLYTYGNKKCLDYKISQQVVKTRSAEARHSLINLNSEMIYKNAFKAVWLNEGHVDFSSSICRGIANIIGPGKDTFLNGIIGAHLSLGSQNFFGLEEIRVISQEEKKGLLLKSLGLNASPKYFNMYLKDEFIDQFVESGNEAAIESFRQYENNELFCDQKDLFMNFNLGRRMMGNIDLFKFFFHDVHPFIDYDLFELYSSIPAKLKIGHYLYQELLKKFFPDLASIPWTNTGKNLFVKDPLKRKNLKRDLKKKYIYYTARLSNGKISIKDNDTYIHNSIWLRKDKEFRRFVFSNIDDIENLDINFIDRKKVLEIMRMHDSGRDYLFNIISRIVTVILWYKLFISMETSFE